MGPDFLTKPTLQGDLVTLIPVSADVAGELYPLLADPEVTLLTGSAHSSDALHEVSWSLDEIRDIYDRWSTADDRIVWAILDKQSARVVGEAVINDLDVGNRSCGFRIWISGVTDGGRGTEATRLAVHHAFAVGVHRVELEVYDFNPRARHVYEKVGFRHEGTKRDALRFDDAWVDAHLMSMLATDVEDARVRASG